MKKITKLVLLTVILLVWGSNFPVLSATDYCGVAKTSTNGLRTLNYTCRFVSGTTYEMKLEFQDVTTGTANANIGANPGPVNVAANPVWSSDKKTLTYQFTAVSKPTLYVATIFVTINGAEARWDLPQDANFAAACSSGPTDTNPPTMGTATVVGTPTASSVNLNLTATDDITSPVVNYVANDAANSITNKALTADASGNVTVSGLSASTSYNLTIIAKDAAGNVSANSASVSFTTASEPVAPVPTVAASNVIGIYSDSYTCVANTFQMWASSSSVDVITDGNNSKKITSTNCFGTQVGTLQDISSMKYLHVDIYPTTLTTIQIGIVAPAATEVHPNNTLVANQWNSFDISLASLKTANGSIDLTKLYQVGFWGMNGTFYLDNIYFWTDVTPSLTVSTTTLGVAQPTSSTNTFDITTSSSWTVASDQTWLVPSSTSGTGNATITLTTSEANNAYTERTATVTITGSGTTKTITVTQAPTMPAAAPTPSPSADKVISVYSDTYTSLSIVLQNWSGNTFSDVSLSGNNALKNTSSCCYGYEFTGGAKNVSGMTKLHVDIYPISLASMTFGITGGGEFKKSGIALTASQWNSVDVLLSELTGANLENVAQVGFWNLNGTFYMDNLYFYNDGTTGLNPTSFANGVSCYPNPVKDQMVIKSQSEIAQVIVSNLVGQNIKVISVNSLEANINLTDLAVGNYVLTMKLLNGQTVNRKLVKQ